MVLTVTRQDSDVFIGIQATWWALPYRRLMRRPVVLLYAGLYSEPLQTLDARWQSESYSLATSGK